MKNEIISTLRGSFLIAMPQLADPYFHHSVILMCEHTENGSMGFVVNNVNHKVQSEHIFHDMRLEYKPEIGAKPLHLGGPAGKGELFILHDRPSQWDESFKISGDIGLNLSREMIEQIAHGEGPEAFNLVVGYAVWAPGQLDRELKENTWLVTPAKRELVFDCPVENIWSEAIHGMGINPVQLASQGGNA